MPNASEGERAARAALIWSDISPYHAARSRAAHGSTALSVDTIEVLDRAGFAEFRASGASSSPFPRHELRLTPPLKAAKARPAMHAMLDRLAPEVVFAPGWSMLESLLAIEWCVKRDVPLVMMSDTTRDGAERSSIKKTVKKRIVGLASAALVAGGPQADYMAELGMPRDRIFLGYDAVDNTYFADRTARVREKAEQVRAEHRLPQKYFLCCARLIEEKNMPRLIEACDLYRRGAGADAWELVIVGPGPMQAEIESLIAARGLQSSVHLVGARSYFDLPVYYGLASALILPSTRETWGLVVNEAMASGLPVLVSTRCGSSRDLVRDGQNGFTFDPYDVEAIAQAMRRIASDACDRAAMGAASRAIIAEWGPERFASGFEAAARAALAAPKRASPALDRLLVSAMTWR